MVPPCLVVVQGEASTCWVHVVDGEPAHLEVELEDGTWRRLDQTDRWVDPRDVDGTLEAGEAHRTWLGSARVDPSVLALRPDYRALLMTVQGIVPGPSDETSDALLRDAEAAARASLADTQVEDLPHVAAWRDAYRSFGAKPQRTRNSLEALLRRAEAGLPRVNREPEPDNDRDPTDSGRMLSREQERERIANEKQQTQAPPAGSGVAAPPGLGRPRPLPR